MVDVWNELGDEYIDASNHKNFEGGVYGECMNNIKGYEDRAIMIRANSKIASNFFEDNSLDFVYIDANHAYEFVKEDIELWYPKVKSGGYVMGHDYLLMNWDTPPFAENLTVSPVAKLCVRVMRLVVVSTFTADISV